MFDKTFKFSGKDLTKLSTTIIIATVLFGLPGLIMMLVFQWITYQSYTIESPDKHGISQIGASRLGGAAVFGFSLIVYCLGSYSGLMGADLSKNFFTLFTPAFLKFTTAFEHDSIKEALSCRGFTRVAPLGLFLSFFTVLLWQKDYLNLLFLLTKK